MKRRTGYVSNSSSSSFVVVLDDDCIPKVTKEQEDMLLGYGFRYSGGYWKSVLMDGAKEYDRKEDVVERGGLSMVYDVPCNQQDVEDFLFQNHIPFVAEEEYGTRIVQYDGIHDWYDIAVNAGAIMLMYYMNTRGESNDAMKAIEAKRAPFSRIRISDGKDITEELLKTEQEKMK